MNTHNPYLSPLISSDFPPAASEKVNVWSYWFRLSLSIGLSGALFGAIAGPIGFFFGGLIAFPVSAGVNLFTVVIVHTLGGRKISAGAGYVLGAVAGFCSGVISVGVLLSGAIGEGLGFAAIAGMAGCMGGLVGATRIGRG